VNQTIIVTGGAGFIGANFVLAWVKSGLGTVINLDKLTYAGNLENLQEIQHDPRHIFVHGDIGDKALLKSLLKEYQPRAVLNFAAESHVDRSIHGPEDFIQTNVVGTFHLLEEVRAYWGGLSDEHRKGFRFLHVSTDEVYGSLSSTDPAFTETTPYAPNSPYSASKAASDHLVRAYHHTYGLQVTTSNCSNNYGPYHFPEKLIPLMIVNILEGKPLPIYGDGKNVRDWLHVTDHCRGIELVLKKGQIGEVYNIGGGAEAENIYLVQRLCAIADEAFSEDALLLQRFPSAPAANGKSSHDLITYVKDRPGHDRRYAINCNKIESNLSYRAQVSIDAGLRDTFAWYLANETWWRAVMDGSYRQWLEKHYSADATL
jgi:dTDP-glucose 4,6-dehydratase